MKHIKDLAKGDTVYYIGFDGKQRQLEFIGTNGFVRCVRGRDYTPNFVFKYDDQILHAPLEAWLFTKIKYTIHKAGEK